MEYGIYELMDASLVQQNRFDNISHNLANSNTNAFKKDVYTFDETLTSITASVTDFSPGPIIHTGNDLDFAIEQEGFFKVQTENGIRYSRDGAFTLNNEGVLVTQNGDPVLGQNGPIILNGGTFMVDGSGQVFSDNQLIDKIELVKFEDNQLLKKQGQSNYLYDGDVNDELPVEDPKVQQGYLEKSNVVATEEMIKMIESFRIFEAIQKAIQSIDEVTTTIVSDPGFIQ